MIRAEDFPNRGCRMIWRELMQSRLEPGSKAEVDRDELRQLAKGVEALGRRPERLVGRASSVAGGATGSSFL